MQLNDCYLSVFARDILLYKRYKDLEQIDIAKIFWHTAIIQGIACITLSTKFGLSALVLVMKSIIDHCYNNGAKICFPVDMMLTF